MYERIIINIEHCGMKEICSIVGGPRVFCAWGRDVGTMERRLKLILIYPNGEISPIREYAPSKLNGKVLKELIDLDGIGEDDIEKIWKAIEEKKNSLAVQEDGSGKCSITQAYSALHEYVEQYEYPGEVFVRDGYGNILSTRLQSALDKLNLGYTRLELQKNFKALGLLRVNSGTGHEYAFKINTGSANNWYFSFKLMNESEAAA